MDNAAVKPKLASVPDPDADGKDGDGTGSVAGRVLDWTAVAAGVVLAVIVVDIISGGKITAFLMRRRNGGCQDCGDQDQGEEASGDS